MVAETPPESSDTEIIVTTRYFIDKEISNSRDIDFDASDSQVAWELQTFEDGTQEVIRTLFDFSKNISDRRVNNRIHHRITRKKNLDGLVVNVILRSSRETNEMEFKQLIDRLNEKSAYMKKVKRRKQLIETQYEALPRLPG